MTWEPRVWWIKIMGPGSGGDTWVCKKEPENHIGDGFIQTVKVIEFSAYEQVVQECKRLAALLPEDPA